LADSVACLCCAALLGLQYVPSIYVLLSTVIIVVFRQWPALAFLYLGTYSSWVYLRFFQQQPESTVCGDPSEEFSFSGFFPEFLAPPIDAVATVLGRVTRLQHGANGESKPLLPTVQTALGTNSADANRRRWVVAPAAHGLVEL
jgi:hypothetical protein